jgi:hypothetical protein
MEPFVPSQYRKNTGHYVFVYPGSFVGLASFHESVYASILSKRTKERLIALCYSSGVIGIIETAEAQHSASKSISNSAIVSQSGSHPLLTSSISAINVETSPI